MNSKYAPADRSSNEIVFEQYHKLKTQPYVKELLDTLPYIALIINMERQVLYANQKLLDFLDINNIPSIIGQRPGEILNCIHSEKEPGGCGTSDACRFCGAVNTILKSIQENRKVTSEGRLSIMVNNKIMALDVLVSGTPMIINEIPVIVVSINDISGEKRRHLLERIFFHDLLNTTSNIKGFAQLISSSLHDIDNSDNIQKYSLILELLSDELIEDIASQRDLFLAESNQLTVKHLKETTESIISAVISQIEGFKYKTNKNVSIHSEVEKGIIITDPALLKRVLINLLKNAIEASENLMPVLIRCKIEPEEVVFSVFNQTYIPEHIRLQIFQRSFSTKEVNRGIGTYSVKLLAEEYLKGKVWFESDPILGTNFYVSIPKKV